MGGPWNITKPLGGPGGGEDGREIELQKSLTHVQWRYVGSPTWTNLVALSEITGPQGSQGIQGPAGSQGIQGATGPSIELQKTSTHVQWRVIGGSWADLIALSEITGPTGATGSPGAGSSISNPQVIYVRSDGDDLTGEIGNPGLPFETADAAYDAGVASAAPFSLNLGVGYFTITKQQLSPFFRGAEGAISDAYNTSLTSLTVVAIPDSVVDDNGATSNGANLGIANLELNLFLNGGGVTGPSAGSYTPGAGGNIYLYGGATCRVNVSADGGSNSSSSAGGAGGTIVLNGPMQVNSVSVIGPDGGSQGYLQAFGCDFRAAVLPTVNVSLGGCAIASGYGGYTDKGGNSIW